MRLIYTPEDGERQEFVFRPAKLMSVEAEMIEDVGGNAWGSFAEFGEKFIRQNRRAWRAALWIMLKRQQPKLRFSDLVYRIDELAVELEPDEQALADQLSGDDAYADAVIKAVDEGKGEDSGESTASP